MAPAIQYAYNGEVALAYGVVGDGPVDVVLVPGFVGHLEVLWEEPSFVRFVERIASFARVATWDKREQGLSDRLGRPPTLEESRDDLRAVCDAAGMARPALFGISEGGPMSALFAATLPERISALVLYGTYARLVRRDDYPVGVPPEVMEGFVAQVDRWGSPIGLRGWAPSVADDQRFQRFWERLLRAGTSPRGARALMELYREIDVRDVLAAIATPTLVLHRSGDRMISAAMARDLAQRIPGAQYRELPGEDHLPLTGDVDALLDEVEEFLTGARTAAAPDRALMTVLFTDVVGSTDRAAQLGDRRWRDLIAAHDELVRERLRRHGGREVKTLGDGFLATFDGPTRGIRCARDVVSSTAAIGVDVRAGVHSGECELVGDDVAGMAVNIGARIGALAGPREVLVSSTVRDLVVGSGLDFEDRGEHRLKGVPGEWRVFALR